VHIELRRKTATEVIEPLRLDRLEHLEPLKRRAARWVSVQRFPFLSRLVSERFPFSRKLFFLILWG